MAAVAIHAAAAVLAMLAPRPLALRVPPPRMGLFDGLDLEKLDAALSNLRVLKEFEQRPNRIILVRHGESEGNIDRSAYSTTPDSQIALTEHGFAQGAVAGLQIRQLIGNETVRFFVSPYLRARQTLLAILRAFDGQTVKVSSEPRLREQDFGNFQSHEAMRAVLNERQKFGRFYYRFPNGEAGTDVFDRMASFITYLFRTMSDTTKGDYFESAPEAPSSDASTRDENYVLVTHGLLMRIFCMCYLRWTVYEFEQVWNPSNCEIWVLEKSQQSGTYALAGRWRASPYRGKFMDIQYGESRKEPLPEYMKRPLVSRTVRPGSADALERPELGFLRSASKCLPKPRPRRANALIDTRRMFTANAVIDYWTKDKRTDYWGLDNRAAAWMARSSSGSSNSPRTSEEQCGDDDECLAECDGLGGGRDRVADEGGDPVDRVLYSSISGDPVGASTEESTAQRASGEASPVKSGEAIWKANLESMNAIDRMLTQETIAPQWGESEPSVSAAGLLTGSRIRPKLPPLRVEELDELARMEDLELPLSEHEMELLKRSLSSLNYLGDWSDGL
jgi:broad specificity phosphatase PhoE